MSFSDQEKVLIWLNSIEGLSYKKKEALLSLYKDITLLPTNIKKDMFKVLQLIDMDAYNSIIEKLGDIDKEWKVLEKEKVSVLTILSDRYPQALREVDSPPIILYYKGDIDLLEGNNIAVVGSRKVTSYGRVVTEDFTRQLVRNGFVIVSGLASGVDSIAHNITLAEGGKTIAVLAGGLSDIYPAVNTQLANKIVCNGGLLVTEYSYYESSEPYHFPLRNRIIAGLSKGVLITEAGEKSGSMHTKNYAVEYGKELFLVPGNITSSNSAGCNNAIKALQGAAVTSPSDILEAFGVSNRKPEATLAQLTMEESMVVELLKNGEMAFQEIAIRTHLDTKSLVTLLTSMQIRGIIKKLAGNSYMLARIC